MKKRIGFFISVLLVICLILTNSMSFVVLAQDSTAVTNELLDDVLESSVVESIAFFSSTDYFFEVLQRNCAAFAELINQNDFLDVVNRRYDLLMQVSERTLEICNKLLLLQMIQQKYGNNQTRAIEHSAPQKDQVYTCKGNSVEAWRYNITLEAEDYANIANILDSYSVISEMRGPTANYNCHSYAWYSQATTNVYWIDDPDAFLEDRTYIQSEGAVNAPIYGAVGDIIVYFEGEEPAHSGIIAAVNGTTLSQIEVISKWGMTGLYRHLGDDCPYIKDTETYNCDRIVVYRLCTHFNTSHSCSYNTTTHTCSCSICGGLGTELHDVVYTPHNSTYHRKNCAECAYTTLTVHSLEYQSIDLFQHSITCDECGYSSSALHSLNAANRCTVCGGKGTQIEINSFDEEILIQ